MSHSTHRSCLVSGRLNYEHGEGGTTARERAVVGVHAAAKPKRAAGDAAKANGAARAEILAGEQDDVAALQQQRGEDGSSGALQQAVHPCIAPKCIAAKTS